MGLNSRNPDKIHGVHVSSPAQLVSVFVMLVGLTALTVWASTWDVGDFDVWLALSIAGIKAALVATYFMHLKYDNPTNTLLFLFSIAVVVLFLGLTLSDVMQLAPEVELAEEAAA